MLEEATVGWFTHGQLISSRESLKLTYRILVYEGTPATTPTSPFMYAT